MDAYYPMSTTVRHNQLVRTFFGEIIDLLRSRKTHALSEECSLVYWGKKTMPDSLNLVDISELENIDNFKETAINDLYYVQPDFMLFQNNEYIENKRRTRTAGRPDLIVEIWSESNTKNDRAFLQNLYATSPVTEHWYIDQYENDVTCYYGREKIGGQNLSNILKSRNGLKFDLRYLAV